MNNRFLIRTLGTFAVMLATFFLLAVVTSAIPFGMIAGHLDSSVQTITQEGEKPFHGHMLYTQDNVTDCIMLNIAAGVDASHPLHSAMANRFHFNDGGNVFDDTRDLLGGKQVDSFDYARYWHGNQVLLRPLLVLTDYHGIRIINYLALFTLALLCIFLSYRRVSRSFAIALTIGLACMGFQYIPLNMQYTSCFLIMLVAMLFILLSRRKQGHEQALLLFFVIGGVTAFMDLLTTPLITLGLPVMLWCLVHKPEHPVRMVVFISLMWLLGYASIWAAKWLLASAVTGTNIVGDAMANAHLRTVGGEQGEQGLTTLAIMKGFWHTLAARWPITGAAVLIALGCIVAFYWRCYRPAGSTARGNLWLLLVAVMPLAWSLVLMQHTYIHWYFTWRIWLITIVAVIVFLACAIHPQDNPKKS